MPEKLNFFYFGHGWSLKGRPISFSNEDSHLGIDGYKIDSLLMSFNANNRDDIDRMIDLLKIAKECFTN